MITVTQSRKKSGGQIYDQGIQHVDLAKAIKKLFLAELRYGGSPTSITPTTIIMVTKLMGDSDTTVFSGEESEMAPLIKMLYFFLKSSENFKEEIFTASFKQASKLENLSKDYEGVSPLFMQLGFPMINGENRLKAAIMNGFGITEKTDLVKGLSVKISDIIAAIELKNECNCSFVEALC